MLLFSSWFVYIIVYFIVIVNKSLVGSCAFYSYIYLHIYMYIFRTQRSRFVWANKFEIFNIFNELIYWFEIIEDGVRLIESFYLLWFSDILVVDLMFVGFLNKIGFELNKRNKINSSNSSIMIYGTYGTYTHLLLTSQRKLWCWLW